MDLRSIDGNPPFWHTIDVTTGVASVIGGANLGGFIVSALAYDSEAGTVYAAATNTAGDHLLLTIDPSTGQATTIGVTHTASEFGDAIIAGLAVLPGPATTVEAISWGAVKAHYRR